MSPEVRERIVSGVQDAVILGSGFETACDVIGMSPRRLQRWRQRHDDGRTGGLRTCEQRLSEQEKDAIVAVAALIAVLAVLNKKHVNAAPTVEKKGNKLTTRTLVQGIRDGMKE